MLEENSNSIELIQRNAQDKKSNKCERIHINPKESSMEMDG